MFCLCALALPCAERGCNCSPTLTLLTFSLLGATAMVGCCGSVKSVVSSTAGVYVRD